MTKRISELPIAGGVADTDEFEINQAGVSRKATRGQIVGGLASAAHEHDLADIADAGALAALDTVGTAEIDAAARPRSILPPTPRRAMPPRASTARGS